MDTIMEQSENRPFKDRLNKFYNNKYNSKGGSYQFEEETTSGSSFLEVDDQKSGLKKSYVASSNMSNATRGTSLTSALEVDNHPNAFNATDMDEYSSDVPESDAPHCMACLKRNVKTPATLFCETCEPYGKYICHACLQQHDMWCRNHKVLSLSVKRHNGHNNSKEDVPYHYDTPYSEDIRTDEWRFREGNIPVTRGKKEYGSIESWLDRKHADANPDVSEGHDEMLTSVEFPSSLNHFTDKRPIRVPVHSSCLLPPPLPAFRSRQPPMLPMLPSTLELDRESSADESHITDVDYESIGTYLRPVSDGNDNRKLKQQQQQQLQITEPQKDQVYEQLANDIERQDTISQTRLRKYDNNTLERLGDIYSSQDFASHRTRSITDITRLPKTTRNKKRCSII